MLRASKVLSARSWDRERAADRVALTHDGRHRRRVSMKTEGGIEFLLDLADATMLRDGDGLALDDGRTIAVVAASEPIAEIFGDPHLLSRIAWHIGNRHVPAEILQDRIRIGRDHVLEEMIAKLGAKVVRTEASFDPEPGAYAAEGHSHEHANDHSHVRGRRHEH
jgi:urease accessory protein